MSEALLERVTAGLSPAEPVNSAQRLAALCSGKATAGEEGDPYDDEDRPLFYMSPTEPWSIRSAHEGTAIFGSVGSAKSRS
jgi:hypothetical protein